MDLLLQVFLVCTVFASAGAVVSTLGVADGPADPAALFLPKQEFPILLEAVIIDNQVHYLPVPAEGAAAAQPVPSGGDAPREATGKEQREDYRAEPRAEPREKTGEESREEPSAEQDEESRDSPPQEDGNSNSSESAKPQSAPPVRK